MQLSHVFIAFFMRDQAFPHVFIAFLAPPSFLLGAQWALLGSPFRDGGGAVELLGHPLGPKWCQRHHDEGNKSDLGSSRGGQGSQRLSMRRCWEDVHHFLRVIGYFCMLGFRKKGFVHPGCSVALQLLFSMC